MSKKSKKGKTMPLTDYLSTEAKLITVRESSWAAIVDEEDAKKPIVVDMSNLPVAPRSAVDTDYSNITDTAPFIAHVANLSFEIENENLRRVFADLNPIAARIIREGNRSRGLGLVEFDTRNNLIEALKRTDTEIYGRKIRVSVSDKPVFKQANSNRNNFERRTDEERPEMANRWKQVEQKSDDRPRNDQRRSNFSGYSRDNQRNRNDRQGPGQRYVNDQTDNRSDRPRYTNTSNEETSEPRKERQRLQLQPRTKPIEDFQSVPDLPSSKSNIDNSPKHSEDYQRSESRDTSDAGSAVESSINKPLAPSHGAGASIFGGAKPVDTTAKELEIEKKLKELQLANHETNEDQTEGEFVSNRNRHDYHHQQQEHRGGRRYENDNRRFNDQRREDRYHPSRRDYDNEQKGKYNREINQSNNYRRLSNDGFTTESHSKNPPRNILRRTIPKEDDSNKLQLTNKFDMLDDEEAPSPTIVD